MTGTPHSDLETGFVVCVSSLPRTILSPLRRVFSGFVAAISRDKGARNSPDMRINRAVPVPLIRVGFSRLQSMGSNVATPELFAEALFTDTSSWTVIDRGPFEALLPITVSSRHGLPSHPRSRATGDLAILNLLTVVVPLRGGHESGWLSINHPTCSFFAYDRSCWSTWWKALTLPLRGRRSSRCV